MGDRHIGSVVENLIGIKDCHRGVLTSTEVESLNDACNILTHRFKRFDVANTIINDHVLTINLSCSAIGDKLHEKGYFGNEENINKLLQSGLLKTVENRMTEIMWEVIEDMIADQGEELQKR